MRFSKDSPEYISNGHYRINGVEFMSIWTYKRKQGIEPNTNSDNADDAIALLGKDVDFENSTPDFGGYSEIKLFPLNALRAYFG